MDKLRETLRKQKVFILFVAFITTLLFCYHENPLTNLNAFLVSGTILFVLLMLGYQKVKKLSAEDTFYKVFFPIVFVAIVVAILPVFSESGWPQNHDGILWKIRVETYVMHLSQLDILPIWSARDGHSLGTPDSLFYHKLFYYVSAFFYILTAKMKLSIALAIGLFMFIGSWGIYRVSIFLGNRNWTALILALCFIFLNYTLTNWLLRGAMAEFSAMVFVPLLLLQEFKLIQSKRYSHWMSLTMLLMYLSHSIIAYYAIFTVMITIGFTLVKTTKSDAFKLLKKLSVSAFGTIGIILIYLVPIILLADNFDSSTIMSGETIPRYKMVDFSRYFNDKYEWFSEPYWDHSVQFDLPVLIISIVALVLFLFNYRKVQKTAFSNVTIAFILTLNAFFIYLQTKPSLWFYDLFPGASFIQFPWRLLSFIQVLNLMILGWLLGRLQQLQKTTLALSLLTISLLLIGYPAFHGSMKTWFTEEKFEEPSVSFCSNGEFLPQMYQQEFKMLSDYMHMYRLLGIEFEKKDGNSLKMIDESAVELEKLNVEFMAEITNPSEVSLPFSYSALTRLFMQKGDSSGKVQIPIYRNAVDPRVKAFLPHGKYQLTLKQPTLSSLLIPKKRKVNLQPYEDEISCGAEYLTENWKQLQSDCKKYIFTDFNNRTNEEAHSGQFSVKLDREKPYGFTHDFLLEKDYYKEWELSAWRKGGNAGWIIVVFEEAGSIGTNQSVGQKDSLGWEEIKVKFRIPKQMSQTDNIKIYVYTDNSEEVIYFDDLKLRKLP